MLRSVRLLTVVASLLVVLVATAAAQEQKQTRRRPKTLADRLEEIRDDLLGPPITDKSRQNSAAAQQRPKKDFRSADSKVMQGSPRMRTEKSPRPASLEPESDETYDTAPSSTTSVADIAEETSSVDAQPVVAAVPKAAPKSAPKTAPKTAANKLASKLSEPSDDADDTTEEPASEDWATDSSRRVRPKSAVVESTAKSIRKGRSLEEKLSSLRDANEEQASDEAADASVPTLARRRDEASERKASPAPRMARAERREIDVEATESALEDLRAKTPMRGKLTPSVAGENVLFSGQSPLLSVEAAGPRKVLIGREASFVVTLRNSGDGAANNVCVTIKIPQYVEVKGAQPSAGTADAPAADAMDRLEWKLPRLDAHARETMTLKVIPRKSIPLDLGVQWSCSPEASQTVVEVQEPKLVMSLSGPTEVRYGESKIYKLTMANPGTGDAENVSVNLLPIGRSSSGAVGHRLGTIRAGQSKAIEVELTARQSGTLLIKAQAFADNGLRAEVSEKVLVRRANLVVTFVGPKVKYAGTAATYKMHVKNEGTAGAENVQAAMILPPDAKFVSGGPGARPESDGSKISWSAGTLQPGGERTFEMHCLLNGSGENRLQAMATAADDVTSSAAVTTQVEALADLKLEVRDPRGPMAVGEDAMYEVVIRNRGTKAAEAIELVCFFSDGFEAASAEGLAHEIGQGQVVFKPIAAIAAGNETVVKVHCKASKVGNHIFRAELACESLGVKLASEEDTLFYGDETPQTAAAAPSAETADSDSAAPAEAARQ